MNAPIIEPPAPPPANPPPAPTPTPPAPPTAPSGPTGDPKPNGATFSQDDLNRYLAEERRKLTGSDDYKAAQAALKRVKELEDQQKTESQKEREAREAAEARATAAETRIRDFALRSSFTALAVQKLIPGDRIEDAFRLADLSAVEFDAETGEIKGMDKAVDALVKAKAWLVAAPRSVPDINSGGQGNAPQSMAAPEDELRRRFRL